MSRTQSTVSPVDGSVFCRLPLADEARIDATLEAAAEAGRRWRSAPLDERAALCTAFVDAFVARKAEIAEELTWQMGRPLRHTPGEVGGLEERARHMIAIAGESLADVAPSPKPGYLRLIRREPLGVVLTIAAWNYPYLIAVNSVVPALLAGNAVILKHSAQTPLCAERFARAFEEAGAPQGLFSVLHMDHEATARVVGDPRVDFVAFTGSVEGGRAIQRVASGRFIGVGLELGGKDPAFVREDADFHLTVDNLVDGVFFNSGQSCCAVERIYVHRALYDDFVEAFAGKVRGYRLGNPLEPETTLGPLVRTGAAAFVRGQIERALGAGATPLIDARGFPADDPGGPYMAPQVLVDVSHEMEIMREETFGPAVGIMPVDSDEEAVLLMNDSPYGLTASVWTRDEQAALAIGDRVQTGTWFMNRCDYLDPALAWVGVKDSGRGCSLSRIGYEHLTRPKSFHLRTST